MTKTLFKERVLVLGFLAVILAPALIQTAVELRRGDSLQVLSVFRQKPAAKNLRAYEREMEDASWTAKELRPVMQHAQFALLDEAGDKAIRGRGGWMFYRPGFRYMTERPAPASAGASNSPLSAITAFRDGLAKRNIRLLVMIAPNKESIYPEMLTRRAAGLGVLVCPQTRRLMEDLQSAGVDVVNLFEVFRAAKEASRARSTPPLYLVQDSHWSPAGVEVAAQAVARRILDAGWVQQGTVSYDCRPAPVPRLGDVIRMLQIPRLEKSLAPEEVSSRQVVRQDTRLAYEDSPDSEILVMGDSFLRIYQQDEPKSAGFMSHLARALKQPVTSIINDGGASTLVRQELHRRGRLLANKKLVLWEFVERDIRFGAEGWQDAPLPDPISTGAASAGPGKL